MKDDLNFLKDIIEGALDLDFIEVGFKKGVDKEKGIYTRLPEYSDPAKKENIICEDLSFYAYNVKVHEWEIVELKDIEYAESVSLLKE